LGYFAAAVGLVVGLGAVPGVGELVGVLSPPLRYVVVPLAVAVLGTQAAPDGRTAHRFALDWLRLRLRARRRSAGRAVPLEGERVPWHGVLAVRWDGDAAQVLRGRVRGPARVTFSAPVALSSRRGRLIARADREGRTPGAVVVCAGTVLEVEP
jgi:hypothetical protein